MAPRGKETSMTRRMKFGLIAAVLAVGLGVAGVAVATGGDDTPLTGEALRSASRAALAETGGGQVLETEVGDGDAAFEVEVQLEDGSVVEVQLDAAFEVIGSEPDDDGPGGEEGPEEGSAED
jgi:hypothetical protein